MILIPGLCLLGTFGYLVHGILAASTSVVNKVDVHGGANQTAVCNGVASPGELELFFKTMYTVPDFLFNISKAVVGEVKQLEDKTVTEVRVIASEAAHLHLLSDECHCQGYSCGCCAHLEEDEIHLNSTICVNVSYLPEDYGVSFVMTLNEYVLYNETISVRNPPPVCIGMPFVKEFAELCARLYNIDATPKKLHACIRVEARLKHVLIAKYELGCFNLGTSRLDDLSEMMNEIVPSVIRI